MPYRDNVQNICDALGIKNPILKEDVTVVALEFKVDGQWTRVEGADMNRAGLVYFQYIFRMEYKKGGSFEHQWNEGILFLDLVLHFQDIWDDAEEMRRSLIIPLKKSEAVRVHWK